VTGTRTADSGRRTAAADAPATRLERAAYVALLAFAASTQLSIAAAGIFLTLTTVLWLAVVVRGRERVEVPRMFWPLLAYAAATLVATIFSVDPKTSLIDDKQLALFIIVPIAYRLLPGRRSLSAVDVVITIGALTAVFGIIQFGILDFDSEERRPEGFLTHYMTYSGVLMLVACTAAARILFRHQDRMWASLVMPALIVALATTLSRNAWVGACAGIGLLLLMRDFRLIAALPVIVALFVAFAPPVISDRIYSIFSVHDADAGGQSNRDRIAMIKTGMRIIKDDPLTGVGPEMIGPMYPVYRDPTAVKQLNPHLHNVPVQIAAERGLPAMFIWLWFVITLVRDFVKQRKRTALPSLPTTGLACVVAMVAAGMFEYNFGDSEFLMLFLLLVTLPYAADRAANTAPAVAQPRRAA
jgi:O-antigen ligase